MFIHYVQFPVGGGAPGQANPPPPPAARAAGGGGDDGAQEWPAPAPTPARAAGAASPIDLQKPVEMEAFRDCNYNSHKEPCEGEKKYLYDLDTRRFVNVAHVRLNSGGNGGKNIYFGADPGVCKAAHFVRLEHSHKPKCETDADGCTRRRQFNDVIIKGHGSELSKIATKKPRYVRDAELEMHGYEKSKNQKRKARREHRKRSNPRGTPLFNMSKQRKRETIASISPEERKAFKDKKREKQRLRRQEERARKAEKSKTRRTNKHPNPQQRKRWARGRWQQQQKATLNTLDIDQYRELVKRAGSTHLLRRQHYEDMDYRAKRFARLQMKEKLDQDCIKKLREAKGNQADIGVIFWGTWGKTGGRDSYGVSMFPNARTVGLARRIARERDFILVWTDEFYTSMTCPRCHSYAVYDKEAEKRRAAEAGHGTPVTRIRDLKICTNPQCKKHTNRDRMGAMNIGFNGLREMHYMTPIGNPRLPPAAAAAGGAAALTKGKGTKRKRIEPALVPDKEAAADTETKSEGEYESGRTKRSRSSRKAPSRYAD